MMLSLFSVASAVMLFPIKLKQWLSPLEGLILKLPWIGSIIQNALLAYFASTLNTALKAGLPLLESLVMTKDVLQYSAYQIAL